MTTTKHIELTSHKLELSLNPDFIWEAIGPDGIQYPFSTNRYHMSQEQRLDNIQAVNKFDDQRARDIASAILSNDADGLLAIMQEQFLGYLDVVAAANGEE